MHEKRKQNQSEIEHFQYIIFQSTTEEQHSQILPIKCYIKTSKQFICIYLFTPNKNGQLHGLRHSQNTTWNISKAIFNSESLLLSSYSLQAHFKKKIKVIFMRQAKLTAILITFIFVDPVKSVPRFFCSCLLILFFLIQHIYPFIISCYICLLLFS